MLKQLLQRKINISRIDNSDERLYRINNKNYISVTSLLSQMSNKDLTQWYLKLGKESLHTEDYVFLDKVSKKALFLKHGKIQGDIIKKECGDRGSKIHQIILIPIFKE